MIKIIKVKNYTTNAINLSRLSFKYKIIQIREKKNSTLIPQHYYKIFFLST